MVKTCTHKRKTWNSLWTDVLLHSRLLGCLASRVHILLNKSVVCFPKLQKTTSHRLEGLLLFSHPVVSDSAAPWSAAHQASLSLTISLSLLKLMSFESVMPPNHFILCCPLLLLPSILFPYLSRKSHIPEKTPKNDQPKSWSELKLSLLYHDCSKENQYIL